VEAAIKKEMGDDTVVVHKVGTPLTIVSEIDGKKGERECVPSYYNCPAPCAKSMCASGIEKTAKKAAAIQGGAPVTTEMAR